jgi:hypothetical protein
MRWLRLCLVPGAVMLVAIGATPTAHERITTTVTWDREISAIVRARCVTCHREGGRAPMSLATYAEAKPWARAIRHEVLTRRMPVWHAARGYGEFANDPSLSPFEIALVTAWVDGGAPRTFVPRGAPLPVPPGPPESPLLPAELSGSAPPAAAREIVVPCGERRVPPGRLVGLRPELEARTSLRVTAMMPGDQAQVLGWFVDFDPDFAPTYWLSSPVVLPAGSRIRGVPTVSGAPRIETTVLPELCRVALVFTATTAVDR